MSCGYCEQNLLTISKYIVCYECGECYCHTCAKHYDCFCRVCKKKFNKRSKSYQLENLLKIIEQLIPHKNQALISASLSDYYFKKKDYKKLFYYDLKAAKGGIPRSQFFMGVMYYNSSPETRKPDYRKALQWFTWAAENNYYRAFWFLGIMYREARGTKKNLQKSCTCFVLGDLKGDSKCREEVFRSRKLLK